VVKEGCNDTEIQNSVADVSTEFISTALRPQFQLGLKIVFRVLSCEGGARSWMTWVLAGVKFKELNKWVKENGRYITVKSVSNIFLMSTGTRKWRTEFVNKKWFSKRGSNF
jgi:hypothetical protein